MGAIRESEARWVRWAATGVLAGRSLKGLAAELTQRGVTTSKGAQWRPSNLGRMLRQPMLAGYRIHQGEIVGQAAWPAILDVATWDAVRTLLENPERRTSHTQARRYLVSSLATCGVCGSVLRGRNNGDKRPASYTCAAADCVYRPARLVDERVRLWVVARLSQVDARGLLRAPQQPDGREALAAQVQALNANLDALAVQRALGKITEAQMLAATAAVRVEVQALETQMADLAIEDHQPAAVLDGLDETDPAAWFDGLDLDRRRAVVGCLATVRLLPAPRKGARWDPTLVEITPKQ
jgi:hypothetical protein